MDFITKLPPCHRKGRTYENIMVVVDRLSKERIFEPLTVRRYDSLIVNLLIVSLRASYSSGGPQSIKP